MNELYRVERLWWVVADSAADAIEATIGTPHVQVHAARVAAPGAVDPRLYDEPTEPIRPYSSAPDDDAAPEPKWRVGNHQQRNIYRDGEYVGVMFSAETAAAIVQTMNRPPGRPDHLHRGPFVFGFVDEPCGCSDE